MSATAASSTCEAITLPCSTTLAAASTIESASNLAPPCAEAGNGTAQVSANTATIDENPAMKSDKETFAAR